MLLGALDVNLLGNRLTGQGVNKVGVIRVWNN